MANLSFDSNEANRLKSISFEGRLSKLIRRWWGGAIRGYAPDPPA
jgi:hypothetical protein